MPTPLEIALQDAQFVRNSEVLVYIDRPQEWVTMTAPNGQSMFLQGHQAEEFITKVGGLWNYLGDISLDDAELAIAYRYLDALG